MDDLREYLLEELRADAENLDIEYYRLRNKAMRKANEKANEFCPKATFCEVYRLVDAVLHDILLEVDQQWSV